MPAPRSPRRARLAALVSVALAITGFQLFLAPPAAQADVSTKITPPYSQDWSNAGLITANDNWTGVVGVEGYLGQDITTTTGTDPQTLLTESVVAGDSSVLANQTVASITNGDVAEFETPLETIALQGSGTADAPNVVFHLDLTGKTGTTFAFNAKDIDGTADNAVMPVATQYGSAASAGSPTFRPRSWPTPPRAPAWPRW